MQKIDEQMFYDFCILLFDQKKMINQEEPQNIHNALRSFIKNHFELDEPRQYTRDIVYLMTALADEIFLNIDWSGKKYWEEHMLEYEFFKTQIAGDLIFSKITELLHNRNSPVEISKIYLYALAFGFVGKYRGMDSDTSIDSVRKELYDFIEKSTKTIYRPNHRLFSEQYACTLPTIPRKLLPDSNQLLYICLCFIVIFLILGSIAWMLETKELNDILIEISTIALRK